MVIYLNAYSNKQSALIEAISMEAEGSQH